MDASNSQGCTKGTKGRLDGKKEDPAEEITVGAEQTSFAEFGQEFNGLTTLGGFRVPGSK